MTIGYDEIMRIPNTLNFIAYCWMIAEESLRKDIQICWPGSDEEFITQYFHGKFGATLMFASKYKFIEKAFFEDLVLSYPGFQLESETIANGLIAEAVLHKRRTESITGGDMGLIIARPQISNDGNYFNISDYRRGLLCQAKIKRSSGNWGGFTKNQIEILPKRMQYLSLLLYSYEDKGREKLKNFIWQGCQFAEMDQVQEWLKCDFFPKTNTSDEIITALGNGSIGTDDNQIIDKVIAPAKNPTLVIRITWPNDLPPPGGPDSSVRISSRQNEDWPARGSFDQGEIELK